MNAVMRVECQFSPITKCILNYYISVLRTDIACITNAFEVIGNVLHIHLACNSRKNTGPDHNSLDYSTGSGGFEYLILVEDPFSIIQFNSLI